MRPFVSMRQFECIPTQVRDELKHDNMSDSQVAEMLGLFDKDCDGALSQKEFVDAIMQPLPLDLVAQQISSAGAGLKRRATSSSQLV